MVPRSPRYSTTYIYPHPNTRGGGASIGRRSLKRRCSILARLALPCAVIHLDLVRDAAKVFPVPEEPGAITSLRVWHCKYQSLRDLALLDNLTSLEIATYPDATFEPIETLIRLERLRVLHLPRIADLSPLRALRRLESLSLATLPSWDTSGQVTEVDTLEPLVDLPALADLELFGVVPRCRSVDDLLRMPNLRRAAISKYPKGELERLVSALDGNHR